MATLSSLGIDNIDVEIDSNEVCGLDGSALNFVEAIEKAGIQEQEKERYCFSVKEPICIQAVSYTHLTLPTNREV